MKTIVPARVSGIAPLAAKTPSFTGDGRSSSGSRSRALGWTGKGGLLGVAGLVACALALPVGCGGSDTGSGSGGSASSSGSDSTTSSAGGSSDTGGSSSTTSATTTTSTSTSSTSTSTSTSTSATSSTSSGGVQCPPGEPGEPNDDFMNAYGIGMLTCKDSDLHTMIGTIAGPTDVDWFFYEGADTFGCLVNPTLNVISTSGPLQVCSYFYCKTGTADVICPAGTSISQDDLGDPGCCGLGNTNYTVNLDCTGTTDGSASVYLQVTDPTSSAVCTDYDLSFHY